MLIVIVIISILITLILPAASNMRHQGRYTAGQANLRSLSQIMIAYAQEQQEQFLNPFRAKWSVEYPGGQPVWTDAVSITDPTMRWSFTIEGCPGLVEANTEGFAVSWYSYMADYRGTGRATPEQFSPADATMQEMYSRVKYDAEQIDETKLIASSFLYSPTFWSKPERYRVSMRAPMTEEMIQTALLSTVRYPAAKVMLYERSDFSSRVAKEIADPSARPSVALADGSVTRADMNEIYDRIEHSGSEEGLMPCISSGCQIPGSQSLFFYATRNGVRGRDLPRN